MGLLPLDIQQKTFRAALRGYAEDEVDEFLDDVVVSMREYEQRLTETDDRIRDLQSQLSEGREAEDALRRTLVAAQRTADQIIDEAHREAEKILSDARADAARMSVESGRETNQMLDDLERLRGIVTDVHERLSGIAGDMTGRISDAGDEIDDATTRFSRWDDPAEARVERTPVLESIPSLDDLANGSHRTPEPEDRIDLEDEVDDGENDELVGLDDEDEDEILDEELADEAEPAGEPGDDEFDDSALTPPDIDITAEDAGDMAESAPTRRPWERSDD